MKNIEKLLKKEDLTEEEYEELENKLEELKAQLEYEYKRMKVCAYGKEELLITEDLENQIVEIKNKLYEEQIEEGK